MGKKRLSKKEQAVAYAMGTKRLEEFRFLCDNVVPCVYAAVAIALYNKGWRYKRINDLFVDSQKIWDTYCYEPGDMTDKCYELTGIDVMGKNEIGESE